MSQYLKYILRGFLTMLGAILAVVLVYFLVQNILLKDKENVTSIPFISDSMEESESVAAEGSVTVESDPAPGGIYLRDLPLTDSQRSMAGTFGIDVDTYYISPETIDCAESSLGSERFQAIVDGESPNVIEATKLMNCL